MELYSSYTEKKNEQDFWFCEFFFSLPLQSGKKNKSHIKKTFYKRSPFVVRGFYFFENLAVPCLKAVSVCNEAEGHITLFTFPWGRQSDPPGLPTVQTGLASI